MEFLTVIVLLIAAVIALACLVSACLPERPLSDQDEPFEPRDLAGTDVPADVEYWV